MATLTLAEQYALATNRDVGDLVEAAMAAVAVDFLNRPLSEIPEGDRRRTLAMAVLDYGSTINQGRMLAIVSFFPKAFTTLAAIAADEPKLIKAVQDAWPTLAGGSLATGSGAVVVDVPLADDPAFLALLEKELIGQASAILDSETASKLELAIAGRILASPSLNAERMASAIINSGRTPLTKTSTPEEITKAVADAIQREVRAMRQSDAAPAVVRANAGPQINPAGFAQDILGRIR